MYIPNSVIQAFKPPKSVTPAGRTNPRNKKSLKEEFCPIGCDPERTTILLSKPSRRGRGRFVTAYYRKVSREAEQKLKAEKFAIFNDLIPLEL